MVGQVHESREALPEADGIDERESHASGGEIRQQADHHRLNRRDRLLPAGAIEMNRAASRAVVRAR